MESLVQKPPVALSFRFPSQICDCQALLASRSLITKQPELRVSLRLRVRARVSVDTPGSISEILSARERRKQRNERRGEVKGEQKSCREIYEEKILVKPSRKYAKDPLNMDRLEERGMQWWIVRVPKHGEILSAENLRQALLKYFPELDFEVWAAPIPSKKMLASGKYSEKRRGLHPGCIFLHCVMNMELYDFIRGVERISGFMGSKVRVRKRMVIVPNTVGKLELEAMHEKVKAEEEEFARLKEEAKRKKEKPRLAPKNKVKSLEKAEVDDMA